MYVYYKNKIESTFFCPFRLVSLCHHILITLCIWITALSEYELPHSDNRTHCLSVFVSCTAPCIFAWIWHRNVSYKLLIVERTGVARYVRALALADLRADMFELSAIPPGTGSLSHVYMCALSLFSHIWEYTEHRLMVALVYLWHMPVTQNVTGAQNNKAHSIYIGTIQQRKYNALIM